MSKSKGRKNRLGRGLGTLISPTGAEATAAHVGRNYFECDTELIDPLPGQPRRRFETAALEELAASIKEAGVIQPLIVRRAQAGRFQLIAGERRLRASRQAGLLKVPVVIRDVDEDQVFVMALLENIQRADLDPIEEAQAYQRLLDSYGFTQDNLAERVGRSRSAVTNTLRLLRLSTGIQEMVIEGELSAGHARAILSAPEEHQAAVAERILTEGLSVREAEALAKQAKEGLFDVKELPLAKPKRVALSPQMKDIQRQLNERFGLKVKLKARDNGSGTVELHYDDEQGLGGILDLVFTAESKR